VVISLDRCTGCQTCVVACQAEHDLNHVSGIRVETVGGLGRDTPGGRYPNLRMHYLPLLCMHCGDAPCISACPIEAISRRDDGIVLIDEKKCDGCQACLEACPYGVLVCLTEKGTVWKCNLCAHRIDVGLEPFCVLCCEMEAVFFGDMGDPSSKVSELTKRRGIFGLKTEMGTRPAVFYWLTEVK